MLAAVSQVALLSPNHFHQAVQGAALSMQPRAMVLDLRAATQDDFWAQGEVLHQHPPVVQHFSLALAAYLPTCGKSEEIQVRFRNRVPAIHKPSSPALGVSDWHVGRTAPATTRVRLVAIMKAGEGFSTGTFYIYFSIRKLIKKEDSAERKGWS